MGSLVLVAGGWIPVSQRPIDISGFEVSLCASEQSIHPKYSKPSLLIFLCQLPATALLAAFAQLV